MDGSVKFSILTFYLAAITAATTLAVDMSLPALPGMESYFQTDTAGIQYTMSIFMLGYAAGQFVCGPLSDRYGRKPVLVCGLILYVFTSLLCAMGSSLSMLVIARGLQGAAAGTGPVLARAIVRDKFDSRNGAAVLSQITQIKMLVPLIAPLAGGYLLLWYGWKSIFLCLSLIGACLAVYTLLRLEETLKTREETPAVFFKGVFRSFRKVMLHKDSFSPIVMVCTIYGGMIAYMNNSPFLFTKAFGVSEQNFGYYYGTSGIALMIAAGVNKRLLKTFTQKLLYRRGIIITSASSVALVLCSFLPNQNIWYILLPFAGYMAGLGFLVPNGIAIAMAPHPREAGVASSLIGGLQILAGSAAVAASGYFYNNTVLAFALPIFGCVLMGFLLTFLLRRFFRFQ